MDDRDNRRRDTIYRQGLHGQETAGHLAAFDPTPLARYTVQDGDVSLEQIAVRFYGEAGRPYWRLIARRNLIDRNDAPPVGVRLVIPRPGFRLRIER